jgi:hypothetical protein
MTNSTEWDRSRVCVAAVQANQRYGQWMPQQWLDFFMEAYEASEPAKPPTDGEDQKR